MRALSQVGGHSRGVNKAFTLIELLVVIAIIGILAAILFPVFSRVRENARRSSCSSNLKQLSLGIIQYAQDYDTYYPPTSWSGQTGPGPDGLTWTSGMWYWPQLIFSYTKSKQITSCPDGATTYNFSPNAPVFGHYGANGLIFNNVGTVQRPPVNEATILTPSTTYMLMDAGTLSMFPYYPFHPDAYVEYLPGTGPDSPSKLVALTATSDAKLRADMDLGRHFGGLNVSFADGHVKWYQSNAVLTQAAACPITGNYGSPPVLPTTSVCDWNPYTSNPG